MLLRSPISRLREAAISLPCSLTNASKRSCRRTTAITFEPSLIRRLAIACPIPDVAPITSTCLYRGDDIFAMCSRGLIEDFGNLKVVGFGLPNFCLFLSLQSYFLMYTFRCMLRQSRRVISMAPASCFDSSGMVGRSGEQERGGTAFPIQAVYHLALRRTVL
jgi:hypothetical protein